MENTATAPVTRARAPRPAFFDQLGAPFEERGTWASRFTWLVLWVIPTAVVITAMSLTPSAAGHGTHTQLGLPPCGFLVFTGYPCPGCGLTTAFSHMVRLELVGAWTANPFGIPLFLGTVLFIPLALAGMARGWPVVATLDRIHAEKVAIALALMSLGVWLTRVVMQYAATA